MRILVAYSTTDGHTRRDLRKASRRVFAGKIDYPRYGFLDRTIIRLAMRLTGGPAGRDAVVDFTDWNRVDEFGRIIGQKE